LVLQLGLNNLVLKRTNILKTDFEENSFDVILCCQVLHHIFEKESENLAVLFEKCYYFLRPKGYIVIEEVFRHSVWEFIRIYYKSINWKTKRNPRFWIKSIMEVGFKFVGIKYYVPYRLRYLKLLLNNGLAWFFLSSKYFIYGVK